MYSQVSSTLNIVDQLGKLLQWHVERTGERCPVIYLGAEEWSAVKAWQGMLNKHGWPYCSYQFGGATIILVNKDSYAAAISISK